MKKRKRYRFSLIVNELKDSEFSKYTLSLLELIRCLLSADEEVEKITIGGILNELIGEKSPVEF